MRLIDADVLCERACSLEAQALDYVGKLIERDGDEVSVEWKIWSAILTERTAFKYDVFDAPTIEPVRMKGKWIDMNTKTELYCPRYKCSACGNWANHSNYCPNCGASMVRGEEDETD